MIELKQIELNLIAPSETTIKDKFQLNFIAFCISFNTKTDVC